MAAAKKAKARLGAYRAKRDFRVTPEPAGDTEPEEGDELNFVIQKHDATRVHFDLRLELDGVMKSWAVPKGPSLDPATKRLAMEVEDHPIEYNSFEGVIPQGEYGGGTVMLWDIGTYRPDEPSDDPHAALRRGYERGDLKITFQGARLRGSWVLVRMKRPGKPQWLLIKHRDEWAEPGVDIAAIEDTSVATGRTMEEIAEQAGSVWHSNREPADESASAANRSARHRRSASKPARAGASKSRTAARSIAKAAEWLRPMLATLADRVPEGKDWTFEPKYDGIRVIAVATQEGAALITRNANDKAAQFPEITRAVQDMAIARDAPIVLDGEIVATARGEIARFQALQARMHVTNKGDIARHVEDTPVAFVVFDLLMDDEDALVAEPWSTRRERLEKVMSTEHDPLVRLADSRSGDGKAMLEHAREAEWEGIIAKRTSSPYRPATRSRDWLKLKVEHRQELVVGGWTEPRNSRERLGAILLGYYEGDSFVYAGHTGGGFTREGLRDMHERLAPLERRTSPFSTTPRTNEAPHWVEPQVVVEVKFSEWTQDGKLRQPIFLGVRDDKDPRDVIREELAGNSFASRAPRTPKRETRAASREKPHKAGRTASSRRSSGSLKSTPATDSSADVVEQLERIEAGRGDGTLQLPDGNELEVTSLGKLYFTRPDISKGAMLRYYAAVAPAILPALADRPLVMKRSPDGIDGETFFQQRPPTGLPKIVRVENVDTESGPQPRVVGGDLATLLALAQLGVISMDPWHSRIGSLDEPDYSYLDLDPGEGTSFSTVVEVALAVHDELETLRLCGAARTSGSSGIHIGLPLPAGLTYDVSVLLAEFIATRVAEANPGIATVVRSVKKRPAGTVYVDYMQNVKGKSLASVYSVRARRGATVATPVAWKEVSPDLDIRHFTMDVVRERLKDLGDVWAAETRRGNKLEDILAIAGART